MVASPARWRIPHSRYNDLPEEALVARGYCILSRSPETGVDIILKQRKSLSFFCKAIRILPGHPAARIPPGHRQVPVRRTDSYPATPSGYFDEKTVAALAVFQRLAFENRDIDLLSSFPAAEAAKKLVHAWRGPSVRIFANWLAYLKAATPGVKLRAN